MGYGFFEPCIVYGFYEKNQTKIICSDFIEKHNLERYALYTNKGECFNFVYGKSCKSIEDMNTIDTAHVYKIFEMVSKKSEYVSPSFLLALSGNLITTGYNQYDPESDS